MSPVTAPADKRFRRAHVKPGRRRRWYAVVLPVARYAVLTLIALVALYSGATAITHASALAIDDIAVAGNHHLATAEVLKLVDGLKGQNLLITNLEEWRKRLLRSRWIKDATFKRALPSSLQITVRERVPLGLGRIDGHLYLVDERGEPIDEYGPAYAEFDLPIVDGIDARGKAGNGARAALAADVLTALRGAPELAKRVSQIDVTNEHNAAIILSGDATLIYVGTDHVVQRLQSYLELAPTMKESIAEIDYVDLRFDDHIFAWPAGTSGTSDARGTRGSVAAPQPPLDATKRKKRTQR